MGDVLYVLGRVDSKTASWEIKRLVEIVRIVWSIRATKEFFVNGINKLEMEDSDFAKYITNSFRYMVGGFMVNPDCAKFLPYNYGQQQGHNDWIFATFDAAKYSSKYSNEEKDDVLDVLNFIYVFQPPADSVRELKEDEKILPLPRWRTYDNHEEAYFERRIQSSSNTTIHLALNYMSLFTNMLSANVLGNSIASQTTKDDSLLIKLAKGWQTKYIMFFPFYSMDYMYRLYNKVHRDSLTKAKQYSDLKTALEAFLDMFYDQTKEIEDLIIKQYFNAEPCEEAETPLAICCYSKRMKSFRKQVTENDEMSLINKLTNCFDDIKGENLKKLKRAIKKFESDLKKQEEDNLPKAFTRISRILRTNIEKYSPNKIKDALLKVNISNHNVYEKAVKEMGDIIKSYENTLEAYVY